MAIHLSKRHPERQFIVINFFASLLDGCHVVTIRPGLIFPQITGEGGTEGSGVFDIILKALLCANIFTGIDELTKCGLQWTAISKSLCC